MTNMRPISTPAVLIFSALLFVGCSKVPEEKSKGPKPAVKVQTTAVQYRNTDKLAEVVGTLYGDEEIAISAKVSGRIQSIPVDMGDRIAGNSVLAQIDPVDFELEVTRRKNALSEALARLGLTELPPADFDITRIVTVQRAKAQAENAQAKLDRARKLFEQSPPLISEQDFADLQTAQKVAVNDYEVAKLEVKSQLATAMSRQSELATADQQLRDTRVVTPAMGQNRKFAVAQRTISVGEYVREGTAMFKLVLDDKIKFRGSLPERFFDEVKVGQTIRIQLTGSETPHTGTISRVSPTVDLATRTFQVEGEFENTKLLLRPGAFVRGEIIIGVHQNVPMVPRKAILSFAGTDKVFTINGSEAMEHVVTLGREHDGLVAITKGLKDEKEVIVSNLGQLANKSAIEIEPTTQPTTSQ